MRIAKVILLASLVAVLVMRPSAARAQALTQPGQTVTLAWSASPEGSVTGYKVYYGEVANSQTNQLDVGQVLTASVPNLQPGVTYFFFATAYDASRIESVPSNLITYTPVVSPQADLAIVSASASPPASTPPCSIAGCAVRVSTSPVPTGQFFSANCCWPCWSWEQRSGWAAATKRPGYNGRCTKKSPTSACSAWAVRRPTSPPWRDSAFASKISANMVPADYGSGASHGSNSCSGGLLIW